MNGSNSQTIGLWDYLNRPEQEIIPDKCKHCSEDATSVKNNEPVCEICLREIETADRELAEKEMNDKNYQDTLKALKREK